MSPIPVIPAKAGIQSQPTSTIPEPIPLGPPLEKGDEKRTQSPLDVLP